MRTIRLVTVMAAAVLLVAATIGPAMANRLAGSPAGGAPFSAALEGEQEVDPTGELGAGDLEASGFAIATINPGLGLACYEVEHDLDPAPFAFHIHVGDAGTNGPVVVDFVTGGPVPPAGCVEIDRQLAREILRDPAGYYFNIHNADFPAGALRGQLSASSR